MFTIFQKVEVHHNSHAHSIFAKFKISQIQKNILKRGPLYIYSTKNLQGRPGQKGGGGGGGGGSGPPAPGLIHELFLLGGGAEEGLVHETNS